MVWCGFVWFRLVSFGFVWFRLVSFGFVWFRLVSFGFVWFRFVPFRFVSFRFGSVRWFDSVQYDTLRRNKTYFILFIGVTALSYRTLDCRIGIRI